LYTSPKLTRKPYYRRQYRAMTLYSSIRRPIKFYNGIMRFPCHSTAFLLVLDCRQCWPSRRSSHEIANKICSRRQPHCMLRDATSPRNHRKHRSIIYIGLYLIFLETRIIDLNYAADSMGLSSFKFFCMMRINHSNFKII